MLIPAGVPLIIIDGVQAFATTAHPAARSAAPGGSLGAGLQLDLWRTATAVLMAHAGDGVRSDRSLR
jgi:hypothetical protein